jgi:fermentation-respiration switch protein FrsA (DUF1100 family)
MREHEFSVEGSTCRALFFSPDRNQFDKLGKHPCIVMAHGFGLVREACLPTYGERFAAAGLAVLIFDYRHFGASDGEPRQLLSISSQLRDWQGAINFARTLDGVDPTRIALFGTSFSGGHVVRAAVEDGKVAAVISQCPMMDGLAAVAGLVRYAGFGQLLKLSLSGLRDAVGSPFGAAPVMVPIIGAPGTLAAMSSEDAEPGYRALLPEHSSWRNGVCARAALTLPLYRPGRAADRLPCPILIQICEKDTVAPTEAAQAAAKRAGSKATVRSYPIGHFDIYLGDAFERAIEDQLAFLRQTLA